MKKKYLYIKDNFLKYKIQHQYKFLLIFLFVLIMLLYKFFPEYFTFLYWGNEKNLNRSETLRNLGLVVFGIVAIIIALWRGIIASNELKNSQMKLNKEKLHKAVELLETNSERNKISAILMLSELITESNNFDKIIFQILYSYLKEYASVQGEFQKYSNLSMDKIDIIWYKNRKPMNYSILFCFENYLKLLKERKVEMDIYQHILINLNLHGLQIKTLDSLIQNSDLSNGHLYCGEHTSFSNCDLTNAVVYP